MSGINIVAELPGGRRHEIEEERERFKIYFTNLLKQGLAQRGIPLRKQASELARLTGRSKQTTTNWLNSMTLPSLDEARRICHHYQFDADMILGLVGLSDTRRENKDSPYFMAKDDPSQLASALISLPNLMRTAHSSSDRRHQIRLFTQNDNDMEGVIDKGEIYGVDTSVNVFNKTGIYSLIRNDKTYIRIIEDRVGTDDLLLSCKNPLISSETLKRSDEGKIEGVEILGQVVGVWKHFSD